MRIDMRIGATKIVLDIRVLHHIVARERLERRVPSTRPIEVAYVITDFGRSALAVLDQLREWAEAQNV
jgi:DNA-binding HxlR family transcriptional regulator